ncbi:MAG: hypothetical protein OIN90_14635 [Candidatus Methanoperedens sp.]|nr:hypothetical protein [Candidatus Methanoperedens sp.]
MEERKKEWEEVSKTLKDDEQKIYKAIIDSDGIINHVEIKNKMVLLQVMGRKAYLYICK